MILALPPKTVDIVMADLDVQMAAQYVLKEYNLKEMEDFWYGRDTRYRRDGTPFNPEN